MSRRRTAGRVVGAGVVAARAGAVRTGGAVAGKDARCEDGAAFVLMGAGLAVACWGGFVARLVGMREGRLFVAVPPRGPTCLTSASLRCSTPGMKYCLAPPPTSTRLSDFVQVTRVEIAVDSRQATRSFADNGCEGDSPTRSLADWDWRKVLHSMRPEVSSNRTWTLLSAGPWDLVHSD